MTKPEWRMPNGFVIQHSSFVIFHMTPSELIALKDPSKLSPEAQALW